jgi:hypothetical protein
MLGTLLTWIFISAFYAAFGLSALATIDATFGRHGGHRRLLRLRRWNAILHDLGSVVAAATVILWSVVDSAIDVLRSFIEWTATEPLWARAGWLVLFLYLFVGLVTVLSRIGVDSVMPLLNDAVKSVQGRLAVRPNLEPDEEALLNYAYGSRSERKKPPRNVKPATSPVDA